MKRNIVLIALAGVLSLFVVMTGCQKVPDDKQPNQKLMEPTPQENLRPTQSNQQDIQATPTHIAEPPGQLTEKDQEVLFTKDNSILWGENTLIRDLQVLIKGDPDTIRWYKENGKKFPQGKKWVYEEQICEIVTELADERNKEGHLLMVQILEYKSGYPKALACAAEAVGKYGEFDNGSWHGDRKAVPALRKLINHEDPEVRLQVAGSLMRAGEGDIALPVLDDIVKAGIPQSTWAILKLFSPEEIVQNGEAHVIVSHDKLLDERGKNILEKALNYPSDEVKSVAAYMLADMGLEKEVCEEIALRITNKFKKKTLKDYGYDPYEGVPTGPNAAPEYYRDSRTCSNAINTLGVLRSKKAIPILADIQQYNTEWWYVCDRDDASRALSLINKAEVSK